MFVLPHWDAEFWVDTFFRFMKESLTMQLAASQTFTVNKLQTLLERCRRKPMADMAGEVEHHETYDYMIFIMTFRISTG